MLGVDIKSFAITSFVSAVLGVIVFFYGKIEGKRAKELEMLNKSVSDALETKKREENRRSDSIDDVVKRMRKYTNK